DRPAVPLPPRHARRRRHPCGFRRLRGRRAGLPHLGAERPPGRDRARRRPQARPARGGVVLLPQRGRGRRGRRRHRRPDRLRPARRARAHRPRLPAHVRALAGVGEHGLRDLVRERHRRLPGPSQPWLRHPPDRDRRPPVEGGRAPRPEPHRSRRQRRRAPPLRPRRVPGGRLASLGQGGLAEPGKRVASAPAGL
ncbi:MAG: hypothetical protein AVDCRST_MAG15-1322, partial [uncultured Rubellimicrobium sp.]